MDKTCLRKSETLLFGGESWHLKMLSFLSTCSNEINFSRGRREASLLYKHGKFSVEIYSLAATFSGHLAHAQCILSRIFKNITIVFFLVDPAQLWLPRQAAGKTLHNFKQFGERMGFC